MWLHLRSIIQFRTPFLCFLPSSRCTPGVLARVSFCVHVFRERSEVKLFQHRGFLVRLEKVLALYSEGFRWLVPVPGMLVDYGSSRGFSAHKPERFGRCASKSFRMIPTRTDVAMMMLTGNTKEEGKGGRTFLRNSSFKTFELLRLAFLLTLLTSGVVCSWMTNKGRKEGVRRGARASPRPLEKKEVLPRNHIHLFFF